MTIRSVLVVDNHDSFTWNLVHYLRELGAEVMTERNDALAAQEALDLGTDAILLSPGPGRPEDAGISLDLVGLCVAARRPLLGVCLGHQAVARHFGARIRRAPRPVHGKISPLRNLGTGLFRGLPKQFDVARYHSLAVDRGSMPECLETLATGSDGTVQALRHRSLPIHGVQFHPESVASAHGHALLANFLSLDAAVSACSTAATTFA
jgi:anthranilate synthase component II